VPAYSLASSRSFHTGCSRIKRLAAILTLDQLHGLSVAAVPVVPAALTTLQPRTRLAGRKKSARQITPKCDRVKVPLDPTRTPSRRTRRANSYSHKIAAIDITSPFDGHDKQSGPVFGAGPTVRGTFAGLCNRCSPRPSVTAKMTSLPSGAVSGSFQPGIEKRAPRKLSSTDPPRRDNRTGQSPKGVLVIGWPALTE
jgi:hypothetical protein